MLSRAFNVRLIQRHSLGLRSFPRFNSSSNNGNDTGAALTPPSDLDDAELHVFTKLQRELSPTHLSVRDVSGGCGSMYAIQVESEKFNGIGMVKQHRLVNKILEEEIKGWHGVQLRTKAAKK